MSEFKSWNSYDIFCKKVTSTCRYVFDNTVQEFLETILVTSKSRQCKIPEGTQYWRSQLGNEFVEMKSGGIEYQDPAPYSKERMRPLPDKAKEGRANPKGISYLYLATDHKTAMAETRPWIGSTISLGIFELNKEITLIDCSEEASKKYYFGGNTRSAKGKEEAVWANIGWAFSIPITQNDNTAEYVPTQIIAELFKNNGIDGVEYKSDLGKGHNIVLFDINVADIKRRFLCEVEKMHFSFRERSGNPFFKNDEPE